MKLLFGGSGCNVTVAPFRETAKGKDLRPNYRFFYKDLYDRREFLRKQLLWEFWMIHVLQKVWTTVDG